MKIKEKIYYYKNDFLSGTLPLKEQLGYAGGIFGNAMGQDAVLTFSDKFNRNYMGISNKNLLIRGNVSTILSFIIPPAAGAWYDTSQSNIRKALRIMPIPFAVTSMLLFVVPSTSALFNFIWVFFFGLFFSIVDTFYDIALNALALKLVTNPKDRKNFYTAESLAATLGSMLPGWLIPIVVGTTDDAKRQQMLYFFVALGFCIIGVLTMYAPYFKIDEKRYQMMAAAAKSQQEEKIKWDLEKVSMILHNRPFMVLQAASAFEMIRKITYEALPYLYDDVFGDYQMKAIIDIISGTFSYAGLFAVPFVGKKISARGMLMGGYAYTGILYIFMSLFNLGFDLENLRKKRYVVGILIGFAGMPNAAQAAARKILVADSTDYMEWYAWKKYGDPMRCDGMLVAASSIVGKALELIKANLYNGLFALVKYQTKDPASNVKPVQTVSTLRGLYAIITLCGLIGNLLAAFALLFDNYTGKRRDAIFKELTELRAARGAEARECDTVC
ncbi:MAG TPA: MFS transporter [Clostridiales bacterium]|nr:MFS transporter [Clostridiales bacterium]HPU67430.1 MFS transporter [Clostridiales bacterium]HXK82951.1 MFS transporter [Clostridiales bacterium]